MHPIRPTRRELLAGAGVSLFGRALHAQTKAKQQCGSVPDAPVPPQCIEWTVVTITDPAVTSWTVPDGVTAVQVEGWGAGAGGADISAGDAGSGLFAGGGGAYTLLPFVPVTPGQVIPIQIGQGGGPGLDGAQTVWNGGQLVADCGLANGNGGNSDNCVPTFMNIVGASASYYIAHDGGYGGGAYTADPSGVGAIVNGAGGGGVAAYQRYGGTGDNNGVGDSYTGGGGAAGGSGVPDAGNGAMAWDLSPGGSSTGGPGLNGSGGGGGPVGGAGSLGIGYPGGGPGGGGGGGSTGAGGRAFWGGGGGAGRPGGRGGDGALAIMYLTPGELCNKVITPGGPYNIVLMDSNAYIYYSTDSGATWTATSVLPTATGFVWFNMVTGVTDQDYSKWAAHAESTRYFPVPGGGGFDFGAVSVAAQPLTNMQTTTPVRFDEMGPGGAALSQNCAYSPNTHQVFVSNYSSLDGTTGFYYNVDLRYSKDDGLTWQGLPGLQGPPWGNVNPRDGQVMNQGWHDICISQDAQVIYVKEIFSLIHKSSDGGVTFKMLTSGPLFYNTPDSIETRMACSPDGLTVMCVSRFELQFWISHDGGESWISYYMWTWVPSTALYTYVTDIGMNLDGSIIFVDVFWEFATNDVRDYFWLSRNGGLTWTQVYPPTAQNPDLSTRLEAAQCKVSQDGSGLSVAYYTGASDLTHTMVDVSNDGGATWTTHTVAITPLGPNDADFAGQWEDSRIWS